MMTDEEVSDLGELLWQCCAASPMPIGNRPPEQLFGPYARCCPFGAMLGGPSYPGIAEVCDATGLGSESVGGFMHGFDARCLYPDSQDARLYELGILFREHALSGEPW